MFRTISLITACGFCSLLRAEVAGQIRLEEQAFVEKQPQLVERSETGLSLELQEREQLSDNWKFKFEPRLRLSSTRNMTDTPIDGDFRDSLLERKLGSTRWQAGSFIKAWEGTDGVNPMDIATVRNFRDPVAAESIGSVGLAGAGSLGANVSWDVLYVPWQTPARLPGNNSPWWPRRTDLPLGNKDTQLLVSDAPTFEVLHHESRNQALVDNYGGRMQIHYEAWDFSAAMFEGAAQIPLFRPIISGDLIATSPKTIIRMTNPIGIRPIEYRRRTYAVGIVSTQQSWIFRLAGRYDQPIGDDPVIPGWSEQLVGGVEKTLTIRNQAVIISAQYTFENRAPANEGLLIMPDPFERSLLLGIRLPFSDELVLFVGGLVDVRYDSSVARINLQKKLTGRWSVDTTAEWIRGSSDTLLGQWKDKSRLMIAGVFRF